MLSAERLRILFGSALALALVGCSADGFADAPGPVSCVSDTECQVGICLLGICTEANEGLLTEVDLEVRPPPASGLSTQQFLGLDITVDDRVEVRLAGDAPVGGVVCTHGTRDNCLNSETDEVDPSPVASRVVAVPQASIPGRRLTVTTEASVQGAYALSLLELSSYAIRVFPDDEARAPYYPNETLQTQLGGQPGMPVDIVLPEADTLVVVLGSIEAGDGVGAVPVPDVRVVVEDQGRVISSVAYTDEQGSFELQLGAMPSTAALLVVRPTEINPSYPEVELAGLELSEGGDLGALNLGNVYSPVPVTGRVEGNDGRGVNGASIFLRGDVGIGEVRRLLLTDEQGGFDADLTPGLYDVIAVAPTDDDAAGMVQSGMPIEVGPGMGPLNLVLQARVGAEGVLLGHEKQGIPDAQITMRRLGPPGGEAERVLDGASWGFSTVSTADGTWSVPVDPGRYRITCEPPPESGEPSWSLVTDVFAEPEPVEIELPPPAIFAGVVKTPDDVVVGAGAEVRVFARVVAEDGEAIRLGTAITDEEGKFGLVLPDLFSANTQTDVDAGGQPEADGG